VNLTEAGFPEHAQQALIGTGNMEDKKQSQKRLVRVVCNYIFPKVKFTLDHDFDADGMLYKKCCKHMSKCGGNRDSFKMFWKKVGWKVARSAINNKRNNVQDNIYKYVIKHKQCPSVISGLLLLDHITLT
jgi:hypothetical protein